MILYFDDYINEKMGIISQFDQKTDIFQISEITNSFMDKIKENPEKEYSKVVKIISQYIKIKYVPIEKTIIGGYTNNEIIYISEKLTNDNYYNIKYTLIHELIHVIQDITSDRKENLSIVDEIKMRLTKPTINDIMKSGEPNEFLYLLYRENIWEIYAWVNNGYISAFKYTHKHPEKTNQEILNYVLKLMNMDKNFFEYVKEKIYNDDLSFQSVVDMLIGQCSEISSKGQNYFDKDVFELPVVKKIRKQLSDVLNDTDVDFIVLKINKIVENHYDELLNNKKMIIDSFIKHLEYWYDKSLKKMGKAIQLGIDDAKR